MSKTALVTGVCGFVGSHMAEYLINQGWEVIGTDLKRENHKKYYCEEGILHPSYCEDIPSSLNLKFIPADLTKKETLYPLFDEKIDVIFHVASLYDYFALWDVLYKVNVEGAKNLAEVAIEKGVNRIIHWSTEGVYGEIKNGPADEDHPKNPPNLYSKSKWEQEKVLWELHKKNKIKLTVIRPGPIYGPRHFYGVYHILYIIARLGFIYIPSFYPRSKTLMFPSVHVYDLVRAARFLAENEKSIGEAYNVLSDCISQTDALEFIAKAFGIDRIVILPTPWFFYKIFAAFSLWIVKKMDKHARKRNLRPKIDVPMVEYITHQYWFSNKKIKELGYKFIYEDPRRGLWDYIGYCKERGLL